MRSILSVTTWFGRWPPVRRCFRSSRTQPTVCAERLFSHCFDCASVARQIAEHLELDRETQGLVFSAALMHDIGKIVLVNAFPERYQNLLNQTADGHEIWQAELEEFGAAHQGIGAYLLDLWGLPAEIIEAVASHHSFEMCAKSSAPCKIAFAANWIVNGASGDRLEQDVSDDQDETATSEFKKNLLEWNSIVVQEEVMQEVDDSSSQ